MPRQILRISFIGLLVVSVIGCPVAFAEVPTSPPIAAPTGKVFSKAMPQRWSYHHEWICSKNNEMKNYSGFIQTRLQAIGNAGFELVSISDYQGPKNPDIAHCYFTVSKRPVE